jgi:phospholipase/lecithinase/hemolysin
LFITIPPFDRSPIRILLFTKTKTDVENAKGDDNLQYRIAEWNSQLRKYAKAFHERHCSISFKIYNANGQLTDILDHPEKYGFKDEWAICHEQECIWNDGIHPTFAVHKLWAEDLTNFLKSG